jgi:predicted component of type VI protein secretion system
MLASPGSAYAPMTLVLQGIKLNDEPMSQPLIGRFDERGGTLGRSDNATLTLPDPERLISRVQAQVLFGDEGYWIEQVSTANSTLHNGRPLSAGMRVLLNEGDELRMGGYTLVAAFESDEASATVLRGRTVIMPPAGPPTRPRAAPVALEYSSAPTEATHNFGVPADHSLMNGLFQGMGIDLPLKQGLSPEFLRDVLTASMKSALAGVLDRFAPTQGEREEAQDDFQRLFARAVSQAILPSPAAAPTDQAR